MPTVKLDPRRVRAVLALRSSSLIAVADAASITPQHLALVVSGERSGSARVLSCIKSALGAKGWAFATRKTNMIDD